MHTPSHADTPPWTLWMAHAVRVASRVERLPAVATSDWGEQAAECIASFPGVYGVAVVLARGARIDAPLEIDAVGVSAGAGQLGQTPLSSQGALCVRSRLEQLGSSRALTLEQPALGADKLWDDAADLQTLQTWGRLGPGDRVVIIQLAQRRDEADETLFLGAALESLTPVLARRARLALGDAPGAPVWLTSRERLVLEQLILGQSVRSIADLLDRSPHTVHDHVKNLHRKLGATSRGALIARALGRVGVDASGEGVPPAQPTQPAGPLRIGARGAAGQVEAKPTLIPARTDPENLPLR